LWFIDVLIDAQLTHHSSEERDKLMQAVTSCHGLDITEDGSQTKIFHG
jgi:hypothetical protein